MAVANHFAHSNCLAPMSQRLNEILMAEAPLLPPFLFAICDNFFGGRTWNRASRRIGMDILWVAAAVAFFGSCWGLIRFLGNLQTED
jgi:hypothetical protein